MNLDRTQKKMLGICGNETSMVACIMQDVLGKRDARLVYACRPEDLASALIYMFRDAGNMLAQMGVSLEPRLHLLLSMKGHLDASIEAVQGALEETPTEADDSTRTEEPTDTPQPPESPQTPPGPDAAPSTPDTSQ